MLYTDSSNKNASDIELQLTNLRTSVKKLEEHQNIGSKQTHEHRPATSGNYEVSRDSDTRPLQTDLSYSISQYVERAFLI